MQTCTACQKALATIVIMDLKNGSVVGQQQLCSSCAESLGVVQPKAQLKLSTEILEDLLGGLKSKQPREQTGGEELRCPGCGMTSNEFKTRGRLGCARCYDAFREALVPLLERVHEATSHRGRFPGPAARGAERADSLAELRRRLQDAITAERYEEAARIRDELRREEQAAQSGDERGS